MKLDVDGPAAPPRSNGELIFDAPWQARVFGLAAAIVETRFGGDREPFRQRLIAAIADEPERPYWDSWAVALEDLVTDDGLVPAGAVDARVTGRNPDIP
ncbi:MAG: nitrile hydratase accessory protein [Acidimicrobiia bacterium]|nr:nitrile hydratase accessory protein [Acidimicrobiia bacterium]